MASHQAIAVTLGVLVVFAGVMAYFGIQKPEGVLPDQALSPRAIETFPDIINRPERNDVVIQSNHRELNDLSVEEDAKVDTVKVIRPLPSLEGWKASQKGALGGIIKDIEEKMIPESWQKDPDQPLTYHRISKDFSLQWQMEADRVVGMTASFGPNTMSADMMALQSLLSGSSEGWQLNWYKTADQQERAGVLSLSDGRNIYYLMAFDPQQPSLLLPTKVYFQLNQQVK